LLVEGAQYARTLLTLIHTHEVLFGFLVHNRDQEEILLLRHYASVHGHSHSQDLVLDDALSREDLDVTVEAHGHEGEPPGEIGQGQDLCDVSLMAVAHERHWIERLVRFV